MSVAPWTRSLSLVVPWSADRTKLKEDLDSAAADDQRDEVYDLLEGNDRWAAEICTGLAAALPAGANEANELELWLLEQLSELLDAMTYVTTSEYNNQLVCKDCGTTVRDVEDDDSLGFLIRRALDHLRECPRSTSSAPTR